MATWGRSLLDRFLRRGQDTPTDMQRRFQGLVAAIRERQAAISLAGEPGLKTQSHQLHRRANAGARLSDLLPEAYALVCEAARLQLGLHPFDTQVLAGIILHKGGIAEMQTGEGKTLAAVFPAVLNALTGQGVHILTFNDYLAGRDAAWMGPVYTSLGLSVGTVQPGSSPSARRAAYECDVTYLTVKEAGFDFLRDHLCREPDQLVQRPFHLAILDEADAILIDEARVPLVIAGATEPDDSGSTRMARLVGRLHEGADYRVNETGRNVELTEPGLARAEDLLGSGDLHALENLDQLTRLNCALHAQALLHRDIDYICREGTVALVDEFTGRVVEDRQWPAGLQSALEAKEGLSPQLPGTLLGSISIQKFLALYPRLSGMTATAQAAADELQEFHGLTVIPVPPHRPCIRMDHPHEVYTSSRARQDAVVAEILQVHATGRPILVGTTSVHASEELAARLQADGITSQVLNARTDAVEARIIAEAGRLGAVTISTNMAGRGTDIRLGGEDESQRDRVVALGGLYVMGTCLHESGRIDQQLRGRAGRQGDPGASRFFISLEDDLQVRTGTQSLIPRRPDSESSREPIGNEVILREIARSQVMIEGQNLDIRRTLWNESIQEEQQRQLIHGWRQAVLHGEAGASPPWQDESRVMDRHLTKRLEQIRRTLGYELVRQVQREVILFHIDDGWCRHLARAEEFREGVHLVRAAGEDPGMTMARAAAESFHQAVDEMEVAIRATLMTAKITASGIDLEQEGLERPSSTWTYMITRDPLGRELHSVLSGNLGLAAGAAFMVGPLIVAWGLYNRLRRRRSP